MVWRRPHVCRPWSPWRTLTTLLSAAATAQQGTSNLGGFWNAFMTTSKQQWSRRCSARLCTYRQGKNAQGHEDGEQPFRGILLGWRNGPAGMSWSSTKGNMKFCTRKEITSYTVTGLGQQAGEQHLKGPGASGGQADHERAHCVALWQTPSHILDCLRKSVSRLSVMILAPYSTLVRDTGSPAQQRHGHTRTNPAKSQKAIRAWEHLILEENLRHLGLFSFNLEKIRHREDLTNLVCVCQ